MSVFFWMIFSFQWLVVRNTFSTSQECTSWLVENVFLTTSHWKENINQKNTDMNNVFPCFILLMRLVNYFAVLRKIQVLLLERRLNFQHWVRFEMTNTVLSRIWFIFQIRMNWSKLWTELLVHNSIKFIRGLLLRLCLAWNLEW